MTLNIKEFEESAMMLPVAERSALIERLIESLDSLDTDEVERLWVEEAERRYRAYKQGLLPARSAADAIQNAQARLG